MRMIGAIDAATPAARGHRLRALHPGGVTKTTVTAGGVTGRLARRRRRRRARGVRAGGAQTPTSQIGCGQK